MNNKNEIFWLDNYRVLYENDSYVNFFPQKNMSYFEKLNSITRFSIYMFLTLLFLGDTNKKNIKWLYLPIIIVLGTIFLYKLEKLENKKETLDTIEKPNITPEETYASDKLNNDELNNCRKPTNNNPFMNVLLTDFTEDPNRPKACDIQSQDTVNGVYEGFYENLYRNVDDVYEKKNSQRTYYTTPSTTIPNDTKSFAEWCYKLPETCKTDNDYCYSNTYQDPRRASRKEPYEF